MKWIVTFVAYFFLVSCADSNNTKATTSKEESPKHKVSSLIADSSSGGIVATSFSENAPPVLDSAKINELSKLVVESTDEYNSITWVKPKTAPKYRSSNGIYCYFGKEGARPLALRLVIQYYNDDWLFISHYRFVIDGKTYSFFPDDVKSDVGYGGKIWEWSDDRLVSSDKELIEALANAKSAKMKLVGRQYYDEKTITAKQLTEIKNIYELYKAMGGQFD